MLRIRIRIRVKQDPVCIKVKNRIRVGIIVEIQELQRLKIEPWRACTQAVEAWRLYMES
jgi:hypothetical protein